jgi:hypothetical protein
MRNRLKALLAALSAGACCLVAAPVGAVTVAGWDFSQFAGDGARFVDPSGTTVNSLPANYSNLDPTFNAGAESARYGTLFFDGTNGSTAATADQFLPTAGSLESNLDAPVIGIGTNPFDSHDILQFEGQVFTQFLSMAALTPLSVVFRAGGPGAGALLRDPVLTFGGLTLSGAGSTTVTVEFSPDGKKYTAATGGPVTLNAADTRFEVPLATGVFPTAFVRLGFTPSGPEAPVIDNVAIEAAANLDRLAGSCLNNLNKNYRGVFQQSFKAAEACVSDYSKASTRNPVTNVLACLGADRKGTVVKAKLKNTDPLKGVGIKNCTCTDPKKCAIPFFGYAGDITGSTDLAAVEASGLQTDLFGTATDLGIAVTPANKNLQACQLSIQKDMNILADKYFNEFVACKKNITNTRGGKPGTVPTGPGVDNPAQGPDDLEACLGFETARQNITKARTKLQTDVGAKCLAPRGTPVSIAEAFGEGQCAGATDAAGFTTCVDGLVRARVFGLIRSVDAL